MLRGGCHCGALTVAFTTAYAPEALPLRACQCGFCRRHGARYTTDRQGHLQLVADADALVRYRFGLRTADFLLCGHCGIYVACVVDDAFACLNSRALDDAARLTQPATPVDYAAETAEIRLTRRHATWTPATIELRR
jgi:hypothetical protein